MEHTETENGRLFDDRRTVRRVFRKILMIALCAALLAAAVISVANDMYAFVKPTRSALLSLEEKESLSDFARRLEQNGILANPHVFSLYVRSKNKVSLVEDFCGDIFLESSMSYRDILAALAERSK